MIGALLGDRWCQTVFKVSSNIRWTPGRGMQLLIGALLDEGMWLAL